MKKALIAGLSALVLASSCLNANGSDFSFRFGSPSWRHHSHHSHIWNGNPPGYYYYNSSPSWYYSYPQPYSWQSQPMIVVPNYNQMIVPAIPVFPQPTTRFHFSW